MNSYASAALFFLATSVVVLLGTFIFSLATRIKIWDEINKGNMAVALSAGGIILGIANIMRFAISSCSSVIEALKWGGIGTVALLVVYFAFELLTLKLNVNEEIGKGNNAVGLISLVLSVAFSYIIGASIS
ncbi:MAG: DUF350 domain-containing protein [Vulcanimicrobiota bacterium]